MGADAARRGQADFVGGGVEAALVVDGRQDLVDVGLEHHAAHDYLVKDVVNLQHGEGGKKGEAGGGSEGPNEGRMGSRTMGSLIRRSNGPPLRWAK